MRDLHGEIDADDARGALDRVRGSHQQFQMPRIRGFRLQAQQSIAKAGRVRPDFLAKQVHHRKAGVAHRTFVRSTSKRRASSSKPTVRS